MTGGGVLLRAMRLGQQAGALDRIEGDVGTGSLLARDSVRPGGEFVGPGFDRIDIFAGLDGVNAAGPAVIAVMDHRLALPFAVLLLSPDQRGADHGVAVAIDVGPDLDPFAAIRFTGKRPPSIRG